MFLSDNDDVNDNDEDDRYREQGPAGQRCVHGHIKHMKHMYEAHI